MANGKTSKKIDPVKLMEIATALVFGIILAVFILGFVPVSHPAITREVTALMRAAGLDSCSVGNVRVALWKGVTLHHVSFTKNIGNDRRVSATAAALTLRGNLIGAYYKFKKTGRPAFSSAAFGKDPAPAFRGLCRFLAGFTKGISLSGADITYAHQATPVLRLQGKDLDATVLFSKKNVGDFDGSFSLDTLVPTAAVAGGLPPLRRLSGDFSYAASTITLAGCKGRLCDGKIRCDVRVDCARRALGGLTFSIAGFDFDEWYKSADASRGRLAGKADCKLTLDSSVLASDSLRGKGNVSIAHFDVVDFPFQRTLVGMLAYPGLSHLRFRKAKADFTVKPGGMIVSETVGEGDSLSVNASGWITVRGRTDQKVTLTVAKIAVPTLSDFVQKTLEETKSGGRVLRLRMYGATSDPKFEIDSRVILQKAVQNMFEDVKNNLQKWLH